MPAAPSRLLSSLVVAAAAAGGLVSTAAPAVATTLPASQLAEQLRVAEESTTPRYDRDLFEHWVDADQDGCDTRREVLIAESTTAASVSGSCSVSGTWISTYDGVTHTDPTALEIDHVVALAEAWRSGASAWDDDRRRAFANDLGFGPTLAAVTGALNQAKGDQDVAEWLPPVEGVRCRYAVEWLQVKHRWELAVDTREEDALLAVLRACGDPAVEVPARGAPAAEPAPDPSPTGDTVTAD